LIIEVSYPFNSWHTITIRPLEMEDSTPKVVDIHTHMYPPDYVKILESRSTIPLVRSFANSPDPRLILLEAEVPSLGVAAVTDNAQATTSTHVPGRPLTKHFSSLAQKIHFMDTHKIDISVISLANPWLDFLSAEESGPQAKSINASFSGMCSQHPGRLYFFATLPLTAPLPTILSSITEASQLTYCRGVILGTSGLGRGLDDPGLLPIFRALAEANMTIFLHPHYGLPNEVWGPLAPSNYGHVLPLALGFPMETTIAVARMYLAGVFDAVRDLRMILAHSGGTLPFLAGRIESCVLHDGHLVRAGKVTAERRTVWDVLREQVYLDAVIYSEVGLKAAVDAAGSADRLMFGTDHPFFPPLTSDEEGQWESVTLNAEAVDKAVGQGSEAAKGIMGGNAVRVLRLTGE
jgi:predicted TIM-barrel fold metal-dependent hydrolase